MSKVKTFAASSATGLALAVIVAVPAFACYPQGKINKQVQDVTTKSAMSDANDSAHALSINSGDILTYTISVSNAETETGKNGEDQMVNTKLTDTLPAGVQLVSDPSQTTITENLGTLSAKQKVTKQYQVKVTSTTNGAVLTNKACFTGTDKNGKNAQNGCDVAVVKVKYTTPTPTPAPTTPTQTAPTATTTAAAPTELPNTGAGNVIALFTGVTLAGALVHRIVSRRFAFGFNR